MAYQLLGRRTEAEDVAQETLARAFVHWRKIRSYAEAWVVRVAGNLAIDSWRRNRRLQHEEAPEALTPGPDAARVDLHRALAPAVSAPTRGARACGSSPICPKPMWPRPSGVRSAR